MIRSLLSFLLVASFFWYFPDIYLWTRNLSNALFQEAANISTLRIEIKVAQPIQFLPLRYGVLGKGEKDYYVELYSENQRKAVGADTLDGAALIQGIIEDTYAVRIAKLREFSETDLRRSTQYGEPVLTEDELVLTNLPVLTVTRDVFAVAVLVEE